MPINKDWVKDPNGICEDHWIDLLMESYGDTDEHWMHASIKWDGCIHLNKAVNVPFSKKDGFCNEKRNESACDDYIHICDLDDYIQKLIKLRDVAIKHFGDDWGK